MRHSYKIIGIVFLLVSAIMGQDVPKADLFLGYSFLRYNSAQTIPAFTANGGIGTLAFDINKYFAIESELGGYHNGNINNHQFDTTSFSYLFGPRVSFNRAHHVVPYIHAIFGGQDVHSSICCVYPSNGVTTLPGSRLAASQNNFASAYGGGLDIRLGHTVMLRPIQIDYYLTRFEFPNVNNPTGPTSNRNQNNLRYAAGIAFNFGGERPSPPPPPPPPPPKMKTCPDGSSVPFDQECPKLNIGLNIRAERTEICPGESVKVAPTLSLPPSAVSHWSINGEPTSDGATLDFGSTGRNPGSYRVGLRVTADGYNDASADTTIRVREYTPVTGTASATPAEIWVGEKSQLSANFTAGQCGGQVGDPTFSASEGSVSGREFDSTTVRFDPPGASEQRKTITITAKASDGRSTGTAETSVVVKQKAATMARRLPDIVFPAKSDRVNNCGKRVLLEELKTLFDGDPGGTVVFVGHFAANEPTATSLDLRRALNAAAVISAGQGICARFPASRILVNTVGETDNGVDFQPYFCGASTGSERPGQTVNQNDDQAKFRRVEVWFVPSGGMMPPSATNAKDAATLGVSKLGCPR